LQRRKLFAILTGTALQFTPIFASWSELWDAAAQIIGDTQRVLVLDELPYAIESDPTTLSALQHAWDRAFQRMRCTIVLCGSQIRVMELIQGAQSPLFGRLTGQWYLQPLPFSALRAFFPSWSAEERIAVAALVGGVPAYLGWLDPELTFAENVRQVVLDPGSQFSAEPTLLIYDEVREPQTHLVILKAFGDRHPQAADMHRLLERLTSQLGETDRRTYQRRQVLRAPVQPAIDYTPYSALIADLEDAIGKRQLVSFAYYPGGGAPAPLHRKVEPYEIEFYERHFYLVAYTRNNRQMLDFRVDRIQSESLQPPISYSHASAASR
jgi:hypothetical protein